MNWIDLLKERVDRRAHYRVAYCSQVPATLSCDGSQTLLGGQRDQLFQITDVGPGGMRVECEGPQAKGYVYDLSAHLTVRVVWARKRKDARCECGLQFLLDTPQRQEAVARFLLEDCEVGLLSPHEKRKYLRVPVTSNICGQLSLGDGVKVPVQVRDLAMSGALLASPEAVYPGTNVRARIPLLADQPALECAGEIVRHRSAKDHELGVRFTRVAANHQELLKNFLVKTLIRSQA